MEIVLEVRDNGLRVHNAPLDVLHPCLTARRILSPLARNGGIESTNFVEKYYLQKGRDVITRPGLLQRVTLALQEAGYRVRLVDQREDWLHRASHRDRLVTNPAASGLSEFVPDLSFTDQFGAVDRELLFAVAAAEQGQIVVNDDNSRIRVMALIGRLFPSARIIIPAATSTKVRRYRRGLATLLNEPVQAVFRKDWNHDCRIFVCNMHSFNSPTYTDWDVVLYPSVKEAIHRVSTNANMGYFDVQRQYVCVSAATKLNARATLRLEAVCGTVLYRQPLRSDSRPVQVEFAMLPIAFAQQAADKVDKPTAFQRKRRLIWCNDVRNDALADVARAFADSNIYTLWKYGILLHAPENWFEQYGGRFKVVVLVEVVEHARQLASRLPGWKIASLATGSIEQQRAEAADWPSPYLHRHIVTSVYAEQVGVNADVVIRADCTDNRWNTNCGPFSDNESIPLLIVDTQDEMDDLSRRHRELRKQEYESRGWPAAEKQIGLRLNHELDHETAGM